MFICPELLYIQMQKTGCTHITRLLRRLLHGREIGKHVAASPRQIVATPLRISSIRNPWAWYVSLWTFGVQGDGVLHHRLTNRSLRRPLTECLRHPARFPRPFLTENRRVAPGLYGRQRRRCISRVAADGARSGQRVLPR